MSLNTMTETISSESDSEFDSLKTEENFDYRIIEIINEILLVIIETNINDKNYNNIIKKQKNIIFNQNNNIPKISIKEYLIRIKNYSELEDNTLIIGLIYIDRLCEISNIQLTMFNIHRILFTAILLAIKYNEDNIYNLDFYAKIAGVTKKELKKLEYFFLDYVDFNLYIDINIFNQYKKYVNNFKLKNL